MHDHVFSLAKSEGDLGEEGLQISEVVLRAGGG